MTTNLKVWSTQFSISSMYQILQSWLVGFISTVFTVIRKVPIIIVQALAQLGGVEIVWYILSTHGLWALISFCVYESAHDLGTFNTFLFKNLCKNVYMNGSRGGLIYGEHFAVDSYILNGTHTQADNYGNYHCTTVCLQNRNQKMWHDLSRAPWVDIYSLPNYLLVVSETVCFIWNCLWSVFLPFWHLQSEQSVVSVQAKLFHFIILMLALALSTTPLYLTIFLCGIHCPGLQLE